MENLGDRPACHKWWELHDFVGSDNARFRVKAEMEAANGTKQLVSSWSSCYSCCVGQRLCVSAAEETIHLLVGE